MDMTIAGDASAGFKYKVMTGVTLSKQFGEWRIVPATTFEMIKERVISDTQVHLNRYPVKSVWFATCTPLKPANGATMTINAFKNPRRVKYTGDYPNMWEDILEERLTASGAYFQLVKPAGAGDNYFQFLFFVPGLPPETIAYGKVTYYFAEGFIFELYHTTRSTIPINRWVILYDPLTVKTPLNYTMKTKVTTPP